MLKETREYMTRLLWLRQDTFQENDVAPSETGSAIESIEETELETALPCVQEAFDANLLERVRDQWTKGDWDVLIRNSLDDIEHHSDRAKVGLAVASAFLQTGDTASARRYLQNAMNWGCDKKLAALILAAGVHNTLGRAAAVSGDRARMDRHFRDAVVGGKAHGDRASLARLQAELQRLVSDLQPSWNHLTQRTQAAAPSSTGHTLPKDTAFYRALENRFRGSRELIKQRVAVYLPFVQPIAERNPGLTLLDLGCGRGEWLEVLKEAGIHSDGVDIDAGMLEGCEQLGLRVRQGDALNYLKQQTDASRICVSLIHVVEHIPFENLCAIVHEACRVLAPQGLLIIETPNPENYTVGSCNFYMDPTHRNPLPPSLLAFVPEYYGFDRVKIIRLQEPEGMQEKTSYTVEDFLSGISPDYAVLAQVDGINETDSAIEKSGTTLEHLWERDYGVSYSLMSRKNSEKNNRGDS